MAEHMVNPVRLPVLASLLVLGACSSSHELAVAKGPLFALNAGHWHPSPLDLTLVTTTTGEAPAAAPVPVAAYSAPIVLAPERGVPRS